MENESVNDIIAEMRMGNTGDFPFAYMIGDPDTPEVVDITTKAVIEPRKINIRRVTISNLADRLESAWKRERAFNAMTEAANERLREHLQIALEGNKKPVGNAAALREVCVKCRELAEVIWQSECGEDVSSEIAELRDLLNFARSAPARNCDRFKTWTEARNAFEKWCCNLSWKISSCCECPHYSVRDGKLKHCFSRWLLAPAAERKGDCDE